MAIKTETFYIKGREFTRIYSDANRYVVRDGISYSEACDPSEFGRVYTEGDLMDDVEGNSEAQEILNILLGEEND